MAWIIGIAAIMAGFEAAGRLQRWEDATLVADCGGELCTYRGAVSKHFVSGDFEVDVPGKGVVIVPKERYKAMSWVGGGVHLPSMLAALAGLAIFGVVTLGDSLQRLRRSERR